MNRSEERLNNARRQRNEAIVARHVHELFQRVPMLCGFCLRPDLDVAELSVFDWPGSSVDTGMYEEAMQSLIDLAADRPEAVQLMRGRTFARAFH